MKLRLRCLTSVFLTVLIIISAFLCVTSTAVAVDGDTITYEYVVTCDESVVAFDGELSYPDALSVESVVVYDEGSQSYYANTGNKIVFNATNVSSPFVFKDGVAMITVQFRVSGDYDKKALETALSEFFSIELIDGGNISYRYANVIDGEVITSGIVDIDNPENNLTDPTTESTEPTTESETTEPTTVSESTEPTTESETTEPTTVSESTEPTTESETTQPTTVSESTEPTTESETTQPTTVSESTEPTTESETTEPVTETTTATDPTNPKPEEITYTVTYNYNNGTEDTFLTRTYKTEEKISAEELAVACYPSIKNPYNDYSVGDARFTGDTTVEVNLKATLKEYTITLNGDEYSVKHYMDVETITTDTESGFLIDSKVVAVGKTFKFFVTGDIDVVTRETEKTADEFASIIFNSLSVSGQKVLIQLVATAKVDDYSRMGVAFTTSENVEDLVKEAVTEVESGTKKAENGIVVHNSEVGLANESGQYQFIYAPYIDVGKVEKTTKIYFYAYVVKPDGTVIVSPAARVNPYDAIA